MKKSILTFKSVTYAIKARRILSRSGISSRQIKLGIDASPDGCTHGIEINDFDYYSAVALLKNAEISFRVKRSE